MGARLYVRAGLVSATTHRWAMTAASEADAAGTKAGTNLSETGQTSEHLNPLDQAESTGANP
jgi:hypothetical protein